MDKIKSKEEILRGIISDKIGEHHANDGMIDSDFALEAMEKYAFQFQPPPDTEIEKWIEDEAKRLGEESTAPDKETPDWMLADIKRGMRAMYSLLGSWIRQRDKEIERLKEYEWKYKDLSK